MRDIACPRPATNNCYLAFIRSFMPFSATSPPFIVQSSPYDRSGFAKLQLDHEALEIRAGRRGALQNERVVARDDPVVVSSGQTTQRVERRVHVRERVDDRERAVIAPVGVEGGRVGGAPRRARGGGL